MRRFGVKEAAESGSPLSCHLNYLSRASQVTESMGLSWTCQVTSKSTGPRRRKGKILFNIPVMGCEVGLGLDERLEGCRVSLLASKVCACYIVGRLDAGIRTRLREAPVEKLRKSTD